MIVIRLIDRGQCDAGKMNQKHVLPKLSVKVLSPAMTASWAVRKDIQSGHSPEGNNLPSLERHCLVSLVQS